MLILGKKYNRSYNREMDKNIICGYMRGNIQLSQRVLDKFLEIGNPFYIHAFDGDDWSNRDSCDGRSFRDEDAKLALYLFNIATYKDAIMKKADEFFIINPVDISGEIQAFFLEKDYSVTGYTYEINPFEISELMVWDKISQLLMKQIKEQKKVKKGVFIRGY